MPSGGYAQRSVEASGQILPSLVIGKAVARSISFSECGMTLSNYIYAKKMNNTADVRKIRVRMIGMSNALLLLPLARLLKFVSPCMRLEINGLRKPNESETVSDIGYDHFDRCLPGFDLNVSRLNFIRRRLKRYILRSFPVWLQHWRFKQIAASADLIHLQGLFLRPIHYYLAKGSPQPLVVSCWGSDVLRTSDCRKSEIQQQVLRAASAITVSGPEFKEIILAKYGRDLAPKIHCTFFDPSLGELPVLERGVSRIAFRSRQGIASDKIIVCLAHNGHPQNQHVDLLRSLAKLPVECRQQLYIVAPMTYGGTQVYREEVKAAIAGANLAGIVISDFMSDEEMNELRLATDILLYAPVSDAFSGSVSQALAAGSVAVIGSWLPYKARIRAGFRYHEIDAPADAGLALEQILTDWPNAQADCEPNRQLSAEFFAPKRIGQQWMDAYGSAIQRFEEENSKK